jgi:LPS O-antigen subunit length determinant protein (WzzB/FepE family)
LSQDPLLKTPQGENRQISADDYISYAGIKGMLAQLFRLFVRMIDFINLILFRNKYLILGGLLLGLLMGYLYYNSKKNAYKVSMIVEFTELNKKTFAEMFSQLNTLILTGSHDQLAQELLVPVSIARNIGFIETFNINNEPLFKDTSTRVNQTFKVVVSVNNNAITDTLQTALIRYLNNNPYLHQVKTSQKKIAEHKLAFIDSELTKLDSLKSEYNRFLANSKINSTFYNNAINPAEIYAQSSNLMNERERTLRWLELNASPVNVVSGFKMPAKPLSSSLQKWLILFGFGGLLIGFLVGLFRELKRTLIG